MICRFCDFPVLNEREVERTTTTRILRVPCTNCGAVVERVEYVLQEPRFAGVDLKARRNRNT